MSQFPMSLNFQGPFNLKGTPGQTYTMLADDNGNLILQAGGEGIVALPTIAQGVVYATDTTGDLTTNAGLTYDGTTLTSTAGMVTTALTINTGGNASGDNWAIESNGSVNFDNGAFTTDGSGNVTCTSIVSIDPVLPASGGTGTSLLTYGQATFVSAGSVAVADASITASSIIVVTEASSTPTDTYAVVLTPSTGFTIHSSNSSSTATVNYLRIN